MPDRRELQAAGRELLGRIDAVMQRADWGSFMTLARRLPRARHVFVTGAGRSGLVARSFAMRLMHAGLTAYIPGETITPAATPEDLLVAISCTGSTGTTEYVARKARQIGAPVVVITADVGSPLAAAADDVVVLPAEAEDIVIRAAVFEHAASLCLDAVFNALADKLHMDLQKYRQRHANLE